MSRKAISITTSVLDGYKYIYALCDDGTVWSSLWMSHSKQWSPWSRSKLGSIPQFDQGEFEVKEKLHPNSDALDETKS